MKHSSKKLFVVEDDPFYIKLIKYALELDPEHEVHVFSTGKDCIDHLYLDPSIVSLDYSLPDMTGDEVMRAIKNYNPNIGIIILSGQEDVAVAVDFMKAGAYDYIVKDEDTKEHLLFSVQRLKKQINLSQQVEELQGQLSEKYALNSNLIGNSKPMLHVNKLIVKALQTNISVSIQGETGTGKEVVARTVHYSSSRRKGSFVAVNVSAIPKDLLESELFGYEKGAFTGATSRKLGQFELADKGTLFLDEIAEMDINLQAKLLRALQEREITRVGGSQPIQFDTRIIVATHRNLAKEVEQGNFREDLYYRLLGLPILMPPLRDRGNDILLLAGHFIEEFCKNNQLGVMTLLKESKEKLMSYSFPGNVRELKAIIELAIALSDDNYIKPEDIQFNSPKTAESFLSHELSLKEYNRKIIHHFLEKYDKDVLLVARKLDIGKSTIYRMLKE